MKRSVILVALCAAGIVLAGCGATAEEKAAREATRAAQRAASVQQTADRGNQELSSGKPETAAKTFTRGLEQARKDNPSLVNAMDEGLDRSVRALVAQARNQAASRNWSGMLRSLDVANKYAPGLSDRALAAEVAELNGSKLAALARTSRAYATMCKDAGWSTFNHIFSDGSSDWFTTWSEWNTTEYNIALINAAAQTQDGELIRSAGELASSWIALEQWRQAQRARNRNRGSDEGWLGLIADGVVAIGSIGSDIKFQKKQRLFEERLAALYAVEKFPATPVASTPRAPAALPPVPAAAGPTATSFAGTSAAAPVAPAAPANPATVATVPRPTTPPAGTSTAQTVDRLTPNFEDLR